MGKNIVCVCILGFYDDYIFKELWEFLICAILYTHNLLKKNMKYHKNPTYGHRLWIIIYNLIFKLY